MTLESLFSQRERGLVTRSVTTTAGDRTAQSVVKGAQRRAPGRFGKSVAGGRDFEELELTTLAVSASMG